MAQLLEILVSLLPAVDTPNATSRADLGDSAKRPYGHITVYTESSLHGQNLRPRQGVGSFLLPTHAVSAAHFPRVCQQPWTSSPPSVSPRAPAHPLNRPGAGPPCLSDLSSCLGEVTVRKWCPSCATDRRLLYMVATCCQQGALCRKTPEGLLWCCHLSMPARQCPCFLGLTAQKGLL